MVEKDQLTATSREKALSAREHTEQVLKAVAAALEDQQDSVEGLEALVQAKLRGFMCV